MKKNQYGFTLIELMIVMVIMGILAAIGVSAFFASQMKGRDATRKADLRSIASALELFYNDKKTYPKDDGNGGMKGCGLNSDQVCTANQPFTDTKTNYMARFPTDVSTPNQRYYYVSATGSQFQLYAHLENANDPQIIVPVPAYGSTSCGVGACNFGIGSPNTTVGVTPTPTP